jgi:signal transduction histidine kinase
MRVNSLRQGFPNVLLLLLILVIVPTAGVVWFMGEAMRNERAAARQTLTAAWEVQLAGSARQVEALWQSRRARLGDIGADERPAQTFARLVREGVADSLVIYDANQRVLYPADLEFEYPAAENRSAAWQESERLEFRAGNFEAAARQYAEISRTAGSTHIAAQALQAQARCLAKAGRKDEAIEIIMGVLAQDRYRAARDAQGRLVVPQALLLALNLRAKPDVDAGLESTSMLLEWVSNYGDPSMPVAQRRFLMRELNGLIPTLPAADTMFAEDLAERYLESESNMEPGDRLSPTALAQVWQMASTDGRIIALFHEATITASVAAAPIDDSSVGPVDLQLLSPGSTPSRRPFLTVSMGGVFRGWQMALHLAEPQAIELAADEEIAAKLWTGALLVAAAVIIAVLIARALGRQMSVTRLKNDLVSTVTHELRTPLASTRLLVDTLLSGKDLDEPKTREYLELIAEENQRLSRLIDDFLSFSRLERNRQTFEMKLVNPADVADAAVRAARGHHEGDRFDVEIDENMPKIVADPEALSTVLVNLLDNAWKYTPEGKEIKFRARQENGEVVFSVQDNGLGLSRRDARRVFNRFYRADNPVSRVGGGMGLGLAIVKFIVDAHAGEVGVESRLGEGSNFWVRLKVAE